VSEFRLGIIGGCMSHQHDTPLNALYHRQLAQLLAADPGVRLRTRIVRAFEAGYAERVEVLLAGPPVDAVMVHIRVLMLRRARLLVHHRDTDASSLVLNPALKPTLLHRGPALRSAAASAHALREPDAYGGASDDSQDLPPRGRRVAGYRLRNVNYLLGALVGLDSRAIEEEMLALESVVRACEDRAVPLIVLGPTPAAYSYWSQRVIRRTNAAIRRRLTGTGIPFALIEGLRDAEGRPLTRVNGLHLTPAGHRYVAERLYEAGVRELARHQRALVE
jgi:hypothetical protein